MNVIVTGGAGFIGSHVVDALVEQGQRVTVVDDLSTGIRGNVHSGATLEQVDVRDSGALNDVTRRAHPDIVIALAASVDVNESVNDPMLDASTNVMGSLNTFLAGVRNGARHLIFSSTGGALYGESPDPATEETPVQPLSPYAVSKYAAELYLGWVCRQYGVAGTILRYANVYGPRQNGSAGAGVVGAFARALLHGRRPIIYGDGLQTRDFVYVDDVVRANLLALKAPPGTYNIGTGVKTSILELARLCCLTYERDADIEMRPGRSGEIRDSVLDAGRAVRLLGWQPRWRLCDGLGLTLEWYREMAEGENRA